MQRFWLYIALAGLGGPLAPVAGAQANANPVTVKLEAVKGSGVGGTVVLQPRGDETNFVMTLTAADRSQQRREFDILLRTGTCSAPGREVEDIDDVHADGRTEEEDEDVRLADLLRSEHIIEVRVEDRDEVVACGEIKG